MERTLRTDLLTDRHPHREQGGHRQGRPEAGAAALYSSLVTLVFPDENMTRGFDSYK